MRVNVYAEEMTRDIEIVSKEIDGVLFTGLRIYLYLPVTLENGDQVRGKFMHHEGDDDSSAITIWGKSDLRETLNIMKEKLDEHYEEIENKMGEEDLKAADSIHDLKHLHERLHTAGQSDDST